jgi:hypothetical protein
VRLFAERAAAVKPGFQVTGQNAAAVAAVVPAPGWDRAGVELAAARVGAMTRPSWPGGWSAASPCSAAGRRGAVARHQTLRATIDWSVPAARRPRTGPAGPAGGVRRRCHPGGRRAVCGGEGIDPDSVFELLAALVARSLVVAEEHGPHTRYRLLETIRQYAQERLEAAGQAEQWRTATPATTRASSPGSVTTPRPPRRGVLGDPAHHRARQPARRVVVGDRHQQRRHRVSILAGFAPVEVRNTYPLLLAGEAALELPGAAGHPGYPLALAVSAVFASNRAM